MFIPINVVFNWWCDLAGTIHEIYDEIRMEERYLGGAAGDDESYIEQMWADLDDVQMQYTALDALISDVDVRSTELILVPC